MSKYDKHNERVERGCGTTTLGGSTETCFRCEGTGIDRFGAHCTQCDNNKEWDTYEYSLFLHAEIHHNED